jgi:hypothetical protein
MRPVRSGRELGQSTVEFALILPLFFAFMVLLFQVALIGRDEVLVVHAARVAAREASLTADPAQIRAAARRTLSSAEVGIVHRGGPGGLTEVEVSYVARTDLPIVGALLPDITLRARASMPVER